MANQSIWRFPDLSLRWWPVFLRNLLVWRKLALPSLVGNIAEPLMWLVAFGYGMGALVGQVQVGGTTVPYILFLASGSICLSAMNAASFEALYSAFSRMHMQKTWDGIMNAPVSLDSVVLAEMLWASYKALFTVTAILGVMLALDISHSFKLLAAWPVLLGVGITFSCIALIFNALAKGYDFFTYYFTLFLTPMMFLSGVFFPREQLPGPVRVVSDWLPLTNAVELVRPMFMDQWPAHPGAQRAGAAGLHGDRVLDRPGADPQARSRLRRAAETRPHCCAVTTKGSQRCRSLVTLCIVNQHPTGPAGTGCAGARLALALLALARPRAVPSGRHLRRRRPLSPRRNSPRPWRPTRSPDQPRRPSTPWSGCPLTTLAAGGLALLAAAGWLLERRRRRQLETDKDSVMWADVQPAGASVVTTAGGLDDILPDSPDADEAARAIYVTAIGETNSRREATLIDLHQLEGKLARRRAKGDTVAAVLLLQQHLVDFRYTSPWAFLELRELYKLLDRPNEWEIARDAFRDRFGQNAPPWAAPSTVGAVGGRPAAVAGPGAPLAAP